MRILVSGGAGFIGSHFAKRLAARGDDVVVLDKLTYSGNRANLPDGIVFHLGDIAEPEDVARAAEGCTAIVNFAAETHVDRSILDPETFGRTEFRGVQVLLEHVRAAGIRLIQVSTDEVYGDLEAGGSSRETDELRPSSPYSAAKAAGDLLVPAFVRSFGVDAAVSPSASDAWAFGFPASDPDAGYVAHFNGKSWRQASFPVQVRTASALSASEIWIGGSASDVVNASVVVEHWNGKTWAKVTVSGPGNATLAVAPDGNGGVWLDGASSASESGREWLCHEAGGHWTATGVPKRDGEQPGVDALAWIPGTRSLWASAGFDADAGEAILKYGP